MIKSSYSFLRAILEIFLFFFFFRSCSLRNPFDNLDLSTQTLIPTITGFKITDNTAGGAFGPVSTAGDIDNDGYDDIIIGAYLKNTVYVIYGGEESSFLDLDLSTTILDPLKTGFVLAGSASSADRFGGLVSTAGDIDNDGYDDIIIGAYYNNNLRGAAYVIYGGPRSTMRNWAFYSGATLDPLTTGFMITGNAAGDQFGVSVNAAGDIDNDGWADIIIGAYAKSSNQGAAYVIYGGTRSSMSNMALSSTTLDPLTTGFTITGDAAYDLFGCSVSTAGDINNDGYDDIIIGAYQKNNNQGAAYVIYGGPRSSMSNIALTWGLNPVTTGFMITGNAATDRLGTSVRTAGDIDNDGYDDIIVGAPVKNTAYVIYGGEKSTMSHIALSSTTLNPLTTGFTITGNAANDFLGLSVSTAGDINKDGYDDIIIGAYRKNANQGGIYVVYGGTKSSMIDIVLSLTPLDPLTTGFMVTGNAASDHFGESVSTAGDINNDGYPDIIVGAGGKNSAYVIYASCSANCKQCSSESVCTECKSSYLMYQYECFASCPEATLQTSTTLCEDCPTHCDQCSSTSVCTECKSSYLMYQFECFDTCPNTTFANTTTTCQGCPNNCNHCTSTSLCTECISPYVLYKSQCLTSCPITIFDSNGVCKSRKVSVFSSNSFPGCPYHCSSCTSEDSCQVCFEGYTLSNSNSLCVLSGAQEKAMKAASSAANVISSVVCIGSTVAPFSALVSKIVQNTRYLNLSVTSDLAEVYQSWNTDLISWDVPNIMSDLDHFEISPPFFSKYDLGSPFLVNFWPTLINIGIGFGTFIACFLFQKVFEHEKYEGWAYSLVQKSVAGSFNFALIQAYACLDDILFYLVLDAKTNSFNGFFSWASLITAVTFLALGCLQIFFNFWTVKKYQSIKNRGKKAIEVFNEKNEYWELFYSDFNDEDLWCQSFFAISIVRSALSSFIITVLYDYPLMQTSYLVIMDFAILSFLYLKTPFNTLRGKLAQYYYEIITLLVHLCTFILSLQDTFKNPSETVKQIMSAAILYLNTFLICGAIGFMFIEIYKTISQKTRAGQLKQYQNIAIQTSTEHIPQRRIDSYVDHQLASFDENFYLLPGMNRKRNTDLSGLNLESNFHNENLRDQIIAPIFYRPLPRRLRQKHQKKRSVKQKNGIHPARFVND